MIIYKVTNLINNKVYIGQTTRSLNERKRQHLYSSKNEVGFKIHKVIAKYGKNNFKWEKIDIAVNKDELNKKEIYWIEYYDSYKNGYNSTFGGNTSTTFSLSYENIVDIFKKEGYVIITEKKKYIDVSTKIQVLCDKNHKWEVRPYAFKNNQRCPKCRKIKSRLSYNDIINDFENSGYKVLKTEFEYENTKNSGNFKFNVICNHNHKTEILYHNFQQGHKCKYCYLIEKNGKKRGGYKEVDVNKIKILYEEGYSFNKIGNIMGLNCKLVKRRLQFIGVC